MLLFFGSIDKTILEHNVNWKTLNCGTSIKRAAENVQYNVIKKVFPFVASLAVGQLNIVGQIYINKQQIE